MRDLFYLTTLLFIVPAVGHAKDPLPQDKCEAMNLIATTLAIIKYEPRLKAAVPDRANLISEIMTDELHQLWPAESERKLVVESIVQGGPYATQDQEAVSAGYYYDLKCRLEQKGQSVRDYVSLTGDFNSCWHQPTDTKVKMCFIRAMIDTQSTQAQGPSREP